MKTLISKVVLAMLAVTVFITGSVYAATDTTAPSIFVLKFVWNYQIRNI